MNVLLPTGKNKKVSNCVVKVFSWQNRKMGGGSGEVWGGGGFPPVPVEETLQGIPGYYIICILGLAGVDWTIRDDPRNPGILYRY